MNRSGMLQRNVFADATLTDRVAAVPLERRRLQCYLAQIVGDIAAIYGGFIATGSAYLGRDGMNQAIGLGELLLPVYLTIALYNGSYSLATLRDAGKGAARAIGALLISAAVVVFIAFYTKSSAEFSRFLFSSGIIATALAMAWIRFQLRAFVRWRCGDRITNELVIRDGGPAIELAGARHVDSGELGLRPSLNDPVALDRIGAILFACDRVIVSCSPDRRHDWALILKGANIEGEVVDETVAELGAHGARISDGQGLLRVSIGPLGLRARARKRLFDIAVSLVALIVLGPLMLLVAMAILLEDGSPVLFVQRRVGRANRFFDMYKFRSMRLITSDANGGASTQRKDLRVTRVGALIRRTSIDELPQIFNVLRGDMAIVGPRPHALGSQAGDKLFWEVDQRYWQRHALKPGMTGLAQVRGLRGATDREDDLANRLVADLEYLDGWSLWRDVRIVVATLRVLTHDRAY